jgi:hypothetical protein
MSTLPSARVATGAASHVPAPPSVLTPSARAGATRAPGLAQAPIRWPPCLTTRPDWASATTYRLCGATGKPFPVCEVPGQPVPAFCSLSHKERWYRVLGEQL